MVDLAHTRAQLRVWRRTERGAQPAELLPTIYGGTYDVSVADYVDDPNAPPPLEISVHPGQLPMVTYEPHGKMRVIFLGGPGSGKTRGLAIWAVLEALKHPNSTCLVLGATAERLTVIWDALLDILEPTGWIVERQDLRHQMVLSNGSNFIGKSGKEPSRAIGSGVQGISADRCVVDEQQNLSARVLQDAQERGRRAGTDFCMLGGATLVDGNAWFIRTLADYRKNSLCEVIRLNPLDNSFVEPEYWERFKADYSDRDWRQRIMSEELTPERLVYSSYNHAENVRPRPKVGDIEYEDITMTLTRRYGGTYRFIFGHDFGVLTQATEILKAYRHRPTGQIHWWVVDEIWSGSHTGTEGHSHKLSNAYPVDEFFVSADPAINVGREHADKSDYAIMRSFGIHVERASTKTIMVKGRVAMLNGLLGNAKGVRRLFIDCDGGGRPRAPKLVESFLISEYDEWGNPENVRKNYRDPTHFPSALSFGLFPWEQIAAPRAIYAVPTRPVDDEPIHTASLR